MTESERIPEEKLRKEGKHAMSKEEKQVREKQGFEQGKEQQGFNQENEKQGFQGGNCKSSDELIELKKQNETLKIQLDETDDRLKRVAAEFENYKKRSKKEKEGMYASLMSDIVSNFLPVIDNLEKAAFSKTEDENYRQGIELVLKQFKDVLAANGVKEIEAVGKAFDPELHEAVSLIQDDSLGEKVVKEEYRKGYIIGDKVIRHSMVVVAN